MTVANFGGEQRERGGRDALPREKSPTVIDRRYMGFSLRKRVAMALMRALLIAEAKSFDGANL
jgi:hypothetical protein